jgi:tRNA(fMet)-specific endonuclease VapC
MYLLDTNHCSRIIAGEAALLQALRQHAGDGVATSAIVRGELLYMVHKSDRVAENLQSVSAFLQTIAIYPVNREVSDVYGKLKGNIIKQFGPKDKTQRRNFTIENLGFGENDLWIASTVIHYNLTLLSTDSDFTRIQQIASFVLDSWV